MYIPKQFQMNDKQMIFDFMKEFSFATVISQANGQMTASHLPLVLKQEENALYGHFARVNKQWKGLDGQPVLAIFHGPHSYISPSWYETKVAVPTWNYTAVHVNGILEIIEDEQIIAQCLHELVNKYEKQNSSYRYDEVDSQYLEGLKKGIVAFKINIETIEGKAKLSQNHHKERQQLVIEQLKKSNDCDDLAIAKLMEQNLK